MRGINDYLRSRSKLYLWLKNALVDTSLVYFKNDLGNYQLGRENLDRAMEPIFELSRTLAYKGVNLKVFLMPYEAQLRPAAPDEYKMPQQMLSSFLHDRGIEFYDLTPELINAGQPANRLFLYGDPMHLSSDGARIVAGRVCSTFPDCQNK